MTEPVTKKARSEAAAAAAEQPPRPRGQVFIASMNLRGVHAPLPPGTVKLNVTSAQRTRHPDRLAFSPMTMRPYGGFPNFEAYWQSGKRFRGIPGFKVVRFWRKITRPFRRYPRAKGMFCSHAHWDHIDHDMLYIESRKRVYVPDYIAHIRDQPRLQYWRERVRNGESVTVYDFDGARDRMGQPMVEEVTPEQLRRRLNDAGLAFGHGYIVAALLADLDTAVWNVL